MVVSLVLCVASLARDRWTARGAPKDREFVDAAVLTRTPIASGNPPRGGQVSGTSPGLGIDGRAGQRSAQAIDVLMEVAVADLDPMPARQSD